MHNRPEETQSEAPQPDPQFTRYDLYPLQPDEITATERDLGLPHLAAFIASVARAQAVLPGGTVRHYLRDLIRQGWFEIVSPSTGDALRSGCSLVLVDKNVVFSFPQEPTLLLGIGDIGQGCPICAALLTDRGLLLGTTLTHWGFSERHLPGLADVIKQTGWTPGPAVGPLTLVLGDANFAHHAWNQLSVLQELVQSDLPDGIQMLTTQQPFGPIKDLFPEVAAWPLTYTADVGLQGFNAPGALFAPVGGRIITTGLVQRIMAFAESRISPRCSTIRTALETVNGPVLWLSVRTRNRTATNQHALLSILGLSFLKAAPDGAIIIDGFSISDDLGVYPSYHQNESRDVVAEDLAAAEALRQVLTADNLGARVHVAVGLTISDSILLSRRASIYFCHHGTVQHKIGWFSSVPGVVHCNRTVLGDASAAWVAAQSEVAILPFYLSPDIVADAEMPARGSAEFAHLLRQENYTVIDIPAAVAAFFAHAAAANVAIKITSEDIMAVSRKVSADQSSATHAARPSADLDRSPNRHLLAASENLIPSGVLYTEFFKFVDNQLRPRSYFEIGTHRGRSVQAFSCSAVCVDPHCVLERDVLTGRSQTHFYQMSSDTFFAEHDLRGIFKSGPDICFLDGMHRSEYLLRDFMNTERLCHRGSLIFMHDCLPVNARMALRTHEPGNASEGSWQHAWTGDVWKIVPLLKLHRPDLKMFILDCAPTGLVAVANLDPASTALADNYGSLLDELRELDLSTYSFRRLWSDLPVISSRSLVDHPEDLTLFLDVH
jgi:hypothetical protein